MPPSHNELLKLHQRKVTRQDIERVIQLAKRENNTEVIFRLSRPLNLHPDKKYFTLEIEEFPNMLNAPRHHGSYKEALTEKGDLRADYQFINGSIVKKTAAKDQKKSKKAAPKKAKPAKSSKKTRQNLAEVKSKKASPDQIKTKAPEKVTPRPEKVTPKPEKVTPKPEKVTPKPKKSTPVSKKPAPSKEKPLNGIVENIIVSAMLGEPETIASKPISTNPKVRNISNNCAQKAQFFQVAGETGKFFQRVERKPVESVVITMDGEQGSGKTTTLYRAMNDFASPGNKCLFISGEEHPDSALAIEKREKYLTPAAQQNIDIIAGVDSASELYEIIAPYDIVFVDSWQKLLRMIGPFRLDEDLRKKVNGKVFFIIFQQTTTGRTRGGAEVVFDGDIITKLVKGATFAENYAYFDKHRYTLVPLEGLRYNISTNTCINPMVKKQAIGPNNNNKFNFLN